MELLGKEPEFNIREGRKIYARNYAQPSSYIDANAVTSNCFIAEGGKIYGTVRHSILSVGCSVGADSVVEDSVIMPNVTIEPGVIVRNAIIGEGCTIKRGSVVGGAFGPKDRRKISVVGKDHVLEENTVVAPGEIV